MLEAGCATSEVGEWCRDHSRVDDAGAALADLVARGALDLPRPGLGSTWDRWQVLARICAHDLSLGRLAEGHTDALAILAGAGHPGPGPGARLGVWAAGPSAEVSLTPATGGWRLSGRRRWCSGAASLSHALVTAEMEGATRLVLVDLADPAVEAQPGTWPAVGMAGSDSLDVAFDGVTVGEDDLVGEGGFYTGRPGFWFGSMGVAACWWGGAEGVAHALRASASARPDPHRLAHLGAVEATLWGMGTLLATAARHIDADPADRTREARGLALQVRHLVERGCTEVLERTGRATGAGPLSHDATHARRVADLPVYLRQHHGEADLAELGRLTVQAGHR